MAEVERDADVEASPEQTEVQWRQMVEAAIIDLTQRVHALEQFGTRVTPDE